ncbi:MAG: hypothetical protein KBD52_00355 [Candidatus Pacebacteria bacterium]|nr:hypothetical protein [Candidatus Paceibacterota bacterium]
MLFKTQFNSLLKISFFIVLLFFLFSKTSFAESNLYFTGPISPVAPSGEFVVEVKINAINIINAVDLNINYNPQKIEFLSFNSANSIIDFWQSEPYLIKDGEIKLSGGILGGFKGNKGTILKIYFKAVSVGNSDIIFTQKNVYLADGKGTADVSKSSALILPISENVPVVTLEKEKQELAKDTTPPIINLTTVKNPNENNNLIVFNVIDKESGVKETQIRYKKYFSFSPWVEAENPVVYERGVWQVELRAINNAELESINTIKMPMRLYGKFIFYFLIIIFIVLLIWKIFRYNKDKFKLKI